MKTCKSCGGELKQTYYGYICTSCGNKYSEDDFRMEVKAHVQPRSNEGVNVFDNNIGGVLEITCSFKDCISSGSGYLIDNSGYAITNTHVVTNEGKPCNDIVVKILGEEIKATVVRLGDDNGGNGNGVDLALLKMDKTPKKAHPLFFADFSKVKNGEQVFVIGNSLGDGTCITSGIVSDRSRILNGKKLLMTDCPINGGNSGGPIFNSSGEVIGTIVSSRIKSDGSATEGMNYAIPSYIVEEFIDGEHTAIRLAAGKFELPPQKYCSCPYCGGVAVVYPNGHCLCLDCRKSFTRTNNTGEIKKALAPCPRCGSWNTNVQNGIFHCMDCDFEG